MFLAFKSFPRKNVALAHLSSPNSIRVSSLIFLECLRGFEVVCHSLQRVSNHPRKRYGLLCYYIFYSRILYN